MGLKKIFENFGLFKEYLGHSKNFLRFKKKALEENFSLHRDFLGISETFDCKKLWYFKRFFVLWKNSNFRWDSPKKSKVYKKWILLKITWMLWQIIFWDFSINTTKQRETTRQLFERFLHIILDSRKFLLGIYKFASIRVFQLLNNTIFIS